MNSYWHFARVENGRPVMRDGTLIEVGKRYTVPEAVMCEVGFHGSRLAIDALRYAPGTWVSKREIRVTETQEDKVCGTECVHIVGADATALLRKFARLCALDVIHLWDAPPVVIRYLKTGDESIRAAAWAAARDDAWAAARAAARDAAWAAARAAARDAAWAAAWDAVRGATWTAASDAALAAARDAQNRRLTRMLNKLLREVTDE